ncbi:MAG TPA: outer membrane beta-barrel protein [Bacteroidales bacterium]|nr:outer membrane beta-barrel protein [Bacteroidales bacterium]
MKNFMVIAFCLMLCIMGPAKSYSQGSFSVHVGTAIPGSDFGSDDILDPNAFGAALGVSIGAKHFLPFFVEGLEFFYGFDLNYHGLQNDVKEEFEREIVIMTGVRPDIKYHRFMNIPITAGFKHTNQLNDRIGLFANVGLAWNFLNITNLEATILGQSMTMEFDPTNNFGFSLGAGIIFNQRFSFSIDYFGLGTYEYEARVRAPGFSQTDNLEGKIEFLALRFGVRL